MAANTSIVVLGAGFVGMYTALKLQKKLRRRIRNGDVSITLLTPESYMTYQPFLPETAAGSLEPRHIVVNLRRIVKKCHLINGRVTSISAATQTVTYMSAAQQPETLSYDVLVVALGSVSRLLPIPGLAENGIGVKSVGEAVLLRNHILRQLDVAASTADARLKRRALTFVVVGGGFAGIETLAELENMSKAAARYYENVDSQDIRWVLVEASGRILPEIDEDMGARTREMLMSRGIEIYMRTTLDSAEKGVIRLSGDISFESNTLIWTAGVKPNPILKNTDLPLDEKGRLACEPTLQVTGHQHIWAAGDCAAVPDLAGQEGQFTPPSAQHAIRQASRLASNIVATLAGEKPAEYKHKNAGAVAGLGLHQGVAQIYGIKLRGWLAWFAHRTYHAAMMPTFNRKVRIIADWTLALFFKRDVVSLGEIHEPRAEFERAEET